MALVEISGVEWGEMLEIKRSLSRKSKQESQPRSGVSLQREKRKRKKHFGRGIHQRILAEGGQGASRLGGLERDEKPRQL